MSRNSVSCCRPVMDRACLTPIDFLDYYFDLLSYVHNRQTRLSQFQAQNPAPPTISPESEYQASLAKYLGRERAYLRKRRTRLHYGDFQILTQVGQGGYGQVFLAQKKDTREICALKVMSKKLLFKMDEIRHVLTERDILTNAKSDWLVRLLYAFQDERSIYLAMVRLPFTDCLFTAANMNVFPRNTSPAATFEPFSTTLASFTTDTPASTLPKCSPASTPSISSATSTGI